MFSPPLADGFAEVVGEESKPPTFAPATKNFAPLICRVVRAMRAVRVLGAGLGLPVGASASLRFSPPTSDESGGHLETKFPATHTFTDFMHNMHGWPADIIKQPNVHALTTKHLRNLLTC